jgi:DNA-binding LacI/PurR family transcriptional regulator
MATIYDVARLAGVSRSTVSRVLNGKSEVDPKTAELVMEAIKKLNYHPNASARALVRQKSDMIGVMLADVTDASYQKIIKGIESVASFRNFGVVYYNTHEDLEKNRPLLSTVVDSGKVDGLLIVGSRLDDNRIIQEMAERGVPIALIERFLPNPEITCVCCDSEQGTRLAVEHFVRLGHNRIGCITGNLLFSSAQERLDGFRKSMTRHQLPEIEEYIVKGNYDHDSGYTAMKQLLQLENPPTAVFVCNDMMAFGAILAIKEYGLTVPEDVAIIGYDDIFFASITYPQLTTVRQPFLEMGKLAAQGLIDRITMGDRATAIREVLPVKLMIRRSCGLFAPAKPK